MPTNYAHYRFGKELLPTLPAETRQVIQRFRRLYDMGLHGPDIFFYHNPFLTTATGSLGRKFHAMSGKEFFRHACAAARTEAGQAYLYGLLGHYCLDSMTHPYVNKHASAGEARHVEMETEFDRFLLEADGRIPPQQQDLSGHMKLTRGECVTVAEFYGAAPGAVLQCVRHMILSTRILTLKKRRALEKLLKLTKPSVSDLLMHETANPRCTETNKGLQVYYSRALKRYPGLLQQLLEHMQTGDPLGDDFEPNFG